jgi:hypothetical protein
MSEKSQDTPLMRVRIIQALLPTNIKRLDPSEKGVLELALARSLGHPQTSYILDELKNLEAAGIIVRTPDKTVKRQNRCRLKDDRGTIKKIYCDDEQYESLKPQIRADFSGPFLKEFLEDMEDEGFVEIIWEMSKKSDSLFTIIVEYSTKQKLSSTFASYLDTYHVLGIEDPELSTCWLWYLLLAQSIIQDEKGNNLEEQQKLFKKMGDLINKTINDRTDLQKKKETINTIEKMLQKWEKGNTKDRQQLVIDCSDFENYYEIIVKKNDPKGEYKLKLEKTYESIQKQIYFIFPLFANKG